MWSVAMRPDQQWIQYKESYAKAEELARDLREGVSGDNLTEAQSDAILRAKEELFLRTDRTVRSSWISIKAFLAIGPGVSVSLFLIGLSLLWAFRGFRGQPQ